MTAIKQALIEVHLQASTTHKLLVSMIYCTLLTIFFLTSMPVVMTVILSSLLLLHSCIYYKTHLSLNVDAIRYYKEGWKVRWAGQWCKANPAGQAVIHGGFMSLPFRLDSSKGRRSTRIILFSDSAETSQLHALRLNIVLNGFGDNKKN